MTVFSWGISRAALLPLFLAAAVVISPPATMAQGNSNERAAFESAKELGTPEAFNAFLSNYSTGFYADLARAYLNKLSGAAAAGTPPATAPNPPAPSAMFPGVTGFNLVMARHAGGAFVKNGPDTWVEQNSIGTGTFRFKEVGRTDAEVLLFDHSRTVYLGLDTIQGIVWYSDAAQPRRPLYQIIDARAGFVSAAQRHPPAAAPVNPSPPYASYPKRATGCEEGQRLVNGRCQRIRAGEKPQGCPKGTVPVPETDDCRPIRRKVVTCKRGYLKIDGKCIKKNEAAGYCGPGYRAKGGKCVPGSYQPPPKTSSRPQWQIDAIKKGCKPGQGWNPQEGCHEND